MTTANQPAILLDCYGLLMKVPTEEDFQRLATRAGSEAIWEPYKQLRADYDAARISGKSYWEQIQLRAGIADLDWAEMVDLDCVIALKPQSEVIDYALGLRAQGYQVGVLSNAPLDLVQRLRAKHSFFDDFEPVIFSGEVGVEKPQKKIYELAREALGNPDDILFFDDNPEFVQGAQEAGLQSFLFESIESIRKVVEQS